MSGVAVSLSGGASASLVTQSDGVFVFAKLPAGSFSLQLNLSNYANLSVSTAAKIGQSVDLGPLAMVKPQGATTGTIKGAVTDAATGLPLAGATVSATGVPSVLTDAGGGYQINNVAPGAVTVVTVMKRIAGFVLTFVNPRPRLTKFVTRHGPNPVQAD